VTGDLGAYLNSYLNSFSFDCSQFWGRVKETLGLNSYLNSFSFDCSQFWARVKETLGYLFASAKLL
jgi:hypothetical protein